MGRLSTGLAGLTLAAAGALAGAPALAAGALAYDDPRLQASQTLQVTIQGEAPGTPLSQNYTADGRNLSPPLAWSGAPANAASYVVIVQDADAPGGPALHWLLYNLPGGVRALARGMKNVAAPTSPLGAAQGWNYHGSLGYSGPRPPANDPPHHYHLQVFALDRALRTGPGARLAAVEQAMAGHVIARGELTVAYATPQPKAKPAQPSSDEGAPGALATPGSSGAPG